MLLLNANETLSTDRLIDELWGERPPATATKTLQVHISRLRNTLTGRADNGSDPIIVTRDHGYELLLDPAQLDSHEFERRVEEGRTELAQGRPERAASALERGLALWNGPPLADVAYEPFAQSEIARLADLRTAALELLIESQLELGRHDEVVPRLEALIRDHPYRERLRAQLMLALYRCDRQADALHAYHDARRSLIEGLGIEPSERLRELERAILAQDPALVMRPVEAAELPPELDTGTLLAGREGELAWLREHWQRARRGAGRLVRLAGPRGMGKTRVAPSWPVICGKTAPGSCTSRAPMHRMRRARRWLTRARQTPTLLVADDFDRADEAHLEALRELVIELPRLSVLVVATAEGPYLPAGLRADASLELGPLDSGAVRAVAQLYAGGRNDVEIPARRGASGKPAAGTQGSCIAARALRRRWNGRSPTSTSSTRASAHSSMRAARRASARTGAYERCWQAWSRCCCSR